MIHSRDQISHTYNRAVADEIVGLVIDRYVGLFGRLLERMSRLAAEP